MMIEFAPIDVGKAGGSEVLAGRLAGEAARPLFEEAIGNDRRDVVIILDFGGVDLATSSYFLGAFEWFWTSTTARERGLFPVFANVNRMTRDEIGIALTATGFRALFGVFGPSGLSEVTPFNVEHEAAETYEQVAKLGEATAADLFRMNPKIQPTGWSNRLALLYEHRLLRRRKDGRQLLYALSWR